jgi:predicted phosphoribosyltransferase
MNFANRLIQYDFSSIDELINEFNKLTKKEVIDLLDVTIKNS